MKIAAGAIILVVDGAKMLLLRNSSDAAYPELEVIGHWTVDNPPNHEQMSDAPGLNFSSMGAGRNTYDEGDPHEDVKDRFATKSAIMLARAARENDGDIIVVAPPDTIGHLRQHYDRAVEKRLLAEIGNDLTGLPVPEITRLISAHRL